MANVKVDTSAIPAEYAGRYEMSYDILSKDPTKVKDGDEVKISIKANNFDPNAEKIVKTEEKKFKVELDDKGSYPLEINKEQSDTVLQMTTKMKNEDYAKMEQKMELPFGTREDHKMQKESLNITPLNVYFAVDKENPSNNLYGVLLKEELTGSAIEDISEGLFSPGCKVGQKMTVTYYSYMYWAGLALTVDGKIDNTHMNVEKSSRYDNELDTKAKLLSNIGSDAKLQEIK